MCVGSNWSVEMILEVIDRASSSSVIPGREVSQDVKAALADAGCVNGDTINLIIEAVINTGGPLAIRMFGGWGVNPISISSRTAPAPGDLLTAVLVTGWGATGYQ